MLTQIDALQQCSSLQATYLVSLQFHGSRWEAYLRRNLSVWHPISHLMCASLPASMLKFFASFLRCRNHQLHYQFIWMLTELMCMHMQPCTHMDMIRTVQHANIIYSLPFLNPNPSIPQISRVIHNALFVVSFLVPLWFYKKMSNLHFFFLKSKAYIF